MCSCVVVVVVEAGYSTTAGVELSKLILLECQMFVERCFLAFQLSDLDEVLHFR